MHGISTRLGVMVICAALVQVSRMLSGLFGSQYKTDLLLFYKYASATERHSDAGILSNF